ncbi:ATP-binding protein [Paenibacillus thermotolerans]|uniref:ATP-binding protein n=1 Tax=Paenibacillus thermotolerans TaxID=3027807 RepID=UPI0023678927|nr:MULTISPECIES: ATP-binding protein [unclassified Paenibacillus]
MTTYSLIRLSYSDLNDYSLLITFSDILGSFAVVVLVWYVKNAEIEKEKLREANNKLLQSDALTGLLNYHEFRKNLEQMTAQNKNTCVAIVDFYNIKTLNVQVGYQRVNETLKWIADQLTLQFPESAICRYSGGQFALAVQWDGKDDVVAKIAGFFDGSVISSTGLQVIYGYSFSNGRTSDVIIAEIENQLFYKERELWLKRDEHIFRADKLNTIGELAAGMAHEIRNPLTTIKGFLQLAKSNQYSNMEQFHDIIMSEITRVSELTAEFLQFSKPQATKMKTEAVQKCIHRAVAITENEVSRNGHQLVLEMQEEPPLPVKVDRDKITQVLVNLIKNAVEAMPEVGKLTVRAYEHEQSAIVEVEDSGIGMTEDTKNKLFEPFFTTKENGTGLGLPITHKIIQDHGGKVDVRSAIGQGTVFSIMLPLAKSED